MTEMTAKAERGAVRAAAGITAASVTATAVALAVHAPPGPARAVLAAVTAGTVLVLAAAVAAGRGASRRAADRLDAAREFVSRAQADISGLADQLTSGARPPAAFTPACQDTEDDPLARELAQAVAAAGQALLRVAEDSFSRSAQQAEVLASLAWRMQSLAHRELETLETLYGMVEKPSLLKGLFSLDQLATQLRRHCESQAVLSGAAPRRQWARPIAVRDVLSAAATEIDLYARVSVVPPAEGTLRGAGAADVIHLIAELLENATSFSPPSSEVLLRVQPVAAGIAIEAEDRGLGMSPADLEQVNSMLADPGHPGNGERLRKGKIGHHVIACIARRHGIRVRLHANIYGGVSAIVIIPPALLEADSSQLPPHSLNSPGEHPRARPEPAWHPLPEGPGARPRLPPRPPAARETRDRRGACVPGPEPAQPPDGAPGPPLPVREPGAALSPELRSGPGVPGDGQAGTPVPGLMAGFLGGISRDRDAGTDGSEPNRPQWRET